MPEFNEREKLAYPLFESAAREAIGTPSGFMTDATQLQLMAVLNLTPDEADKLTTAADFAVFNEDTENGRKIEELGEGDLNG